MKNEMEVKSIGCRFLETGFYMQKFLLGYFRQAHIVIVSFSRNVP